MPQILVYALQLLQVLPQLLAAGQDVGNLIHQGIAAIEQMQIENRDPTSQEWEALNAMITALRADLKA